MSIRKLTDEQFADGTTIDGNRLEGALADAIERVNALEPSDLNRRWTQSQFVWGYQPQIPTATAAQPAVPWMTALSAPASITGSVPDEGVQNTRRVKGTFLPYGANPLLPKPTQWVWSNSWYFDTPVIVRTVHISFHAPVEDGSSVNLAGWDNDFLWDAGPPTADLPPGVADGDFVSDLIISLEVDSPFSAEKRSETSVELHKSNFHVDSQLLRPYVAAGVPPTPALNGNPPLPSDGGARIIPGGLAVICDNVNIPIPRRSRVRVHVVIPEWDPHGGRVSGSPWGAAEPWESQFYSGSMTILEPLEK